MQSQVLVNLSTALVNNSVLRNKDERIPKFVKIPGDITY